MDVLNVKFTDCKTVRESKPYTIYEIEVWTQMTHVWVIYKRYSDFDLLLRELQKAVQAEATRYADVKLPVLPPKRLGGLLSMQRWFVEKRKKELCQWLRKLLSIRELITSPIVLSFLEVPESFRSVIDNSSLNNDESLMGASASSSSSSAFGPHIGGGVLKGGLDERRVFELLRVLQPPRVSDASPSAADTAGQEGMYFANKVEALKQFENYFFDRRPVLSPESITMLLVGRGSSDANRMGLIQTCGDLKYSHIASSVSLFLLCRLLDIERNKDATQFLEVFVGIDMATLRKMQLHYHIIEEKSNREDAFMLIDLLRNAERAKSNAQQANATVKALLPDSYALDEYYRFAEQGSATTLGIEQTEADLAVEIRLPDEDSQAEAAGVPQNVQRIADDARAELLACAESSAEGWLPGEVYDDETQMAFSYKQGDASPSSFATIRVSFMLPCPVPEAVRLFGERSERMAWDSRIHDITRVRQLSNSMSVSHVLFHATSSPYKFRAFTLLNHVSECLVPPSAPLPARSPASVVVFRSVTIKNGEALAEHKFRAQHHASLGPSGYIIKPVDAKQPDAGPSHLTFICQTDKEAVLLYTPDVLGDGTDFHDCVAKLWADHHATEGELEPQPVLTGVDVQ